MTTRSCRPLKITPCNANGIWRQCYEQRQDLHIDVALFSETRLKQHDRFYVPIYYLYLIHRHQERRGGTASAVRKYIPHRQVDLLDIKVRGVYLVCNVNIADFYYLFNCYTFLSYNHLQADVFSRILLC
jgi:hypothetical protein